MAFFVYFSILLRFLILNLLSNILKAINKLGGDILIFILKLLKWNLPSLVIIDVNETSINALNNINYFSNGNNTENNQGSNNYSTDNSNSEDDDNNSENNEGSNGNPDNNSDSEKNRDAMEVKDNDSNSDNDSKSENDSDSDDSENIEKVQDPEHNAPERVMDDLDMVDKARNNDPEALEYLKREYGAFFDDTSNEEALNQIEGYLEEEFPLELKSSEHEADALKAKENAEDIEKEVDNMEKEVKETTDPQIKENLSVSIEILKERAQEEREKAEKSKAKSF